MIIEGKDLSKALPPNQDPIQNKKSMKKKNKKNAVELEDSTSAQFLELTLQAHSVICCRVTPKQKAQVMNPSIRMFEGSMLIATGFERRLWLW